MTTRFLAAGWEFEVFASLAPLKEQPAIRHFEVEKRLLALGGKDFRHEFLERKRKGLKTEPAFAQVLGLLGNRYQQMLTMDALTDRELASLSKRAGFQPQSEREDDEC